MKLTHEDRDGLTVLTLRGDMTADHADQFRRETLERFDHDVRDFILDLAGVEFIDSRGLETLQWLQDRVAEDLGQVRLAGVSGNLAKILEMTRQAGRFECHPDIESAIASLR